MLTFSDLRGHDAYDGAAADEAAAREARAGRDLVLLAQATATEAQTKIQTIQADSRLSAGARQQDVEEVRAKANALIHAYGRAHEAGLAKQYDTTLTRLSTPPTGLSGAERVATDVSFRDATDRANRTAEDGGELLALYSRARRTGDAIQQRAALVVGLERSDEHVVGAWVDENPADGDKVQSLRALTVEMNHPQRRLMRGFIFAGI